VADKLPEQVPENIKHERTNKLIELGNKLEENFVKAMVGTVQRVLFEEMVSEDEAQGYTGQYVRVRAKAQPGCICNVHLTGAEGALAHGEIEIERREVK